MSDDEFSERVFSSPPAAVVAEAQATGRMWSLQQQVEFWCETHDFAPQGVRYLVEVYGALSCHANCWYLWWKYLRRAGESTGETRLALESRLGLDCGVAIGPERRWPASKPDTDMWKERDGILAGVRLNPGSLERWLWLVCQYCSLEQLLQAVWALFVIRLNAPPEVASSPVVQQQLHDVLIVGKSGGSWSFPGEPGFVAEFAGLLGSDLPRDEIANRIASLVENAFTVQLSPEALLKPLYWTDKD